MPTLDDTVISGEYSADGDGRAIPLFKDIKDNN